MRVSEVLVTLVLAGCARGGTSLDPDGGHPHDAAALTGDAPATDAPSGGIDAPIDAPGSGSGSGSGGGGGSHLLLSEVVLAPTNGELIEIVNPTTATVDLSTYYVSDFGGYWKLPTGAPAVDAGDFVAKFPSGATLAPGGVVTIAIATAANFTTNYPGVAPTYSIADATMTVISSNGTATLTNAGELVALFRWDGASDLVQDVDLMLAGVPTAANGLVDKSHVAQDGPDAGSTTTAYATDARTLAVQASTPASGKSTKRIALEAGHETATGGNGLGGHDETSEDTAATWDTTYTAPTPGTVPAALVP